MPSAPQLLARLVPLPRVPRPPMRLPTRAASSATMTSAPRVRVVAPEMAEGRLPRPRAALLATNAICAKIVVARARPTRVKSAVVVAVPASRARMVARARPRLRPHHNRPPANNARERI